MIFFVIFSFIVSFFNSYLIADLPDQKHIIIIIPSYNNSIYYQKNLDSVFMQNYENYRVIYIDDCSTDQTGSLVEQYIKQKQVAHKIELIKNTTRRGALANLYFSIHSCPDNAIIATLDGDDWFAHEGIFAKLNQVYSNPQVWMTYGSYTHFPDHGGKGCCDSIPSNIIQANAFREQRWVSSLLRTFYAGLFKKISYNDLLYKGNFFPVAWDLSFMYPMLEMCGDRFEYISDILYVYNIANSINDSKINGTLQANLDQLIRRKKKYIKLPEAMIHPWDIDFDKGLGKGHGYYDDCVRGSTRSSSYIKDITAFEFMTLLKEIYLENYSLMEQSATQLRIPKIIHQIWLGSPLPKNYKKWQQSWQKLHPDWEYKLWTDEDVKSLTLYNQHYYNNARNYGEKANILRYELLYQFGGVYADMDFECLKPLDSFHYRYDFYCGIAPLDCSVVYINNALIGSVPGHPILKDCIETIKSDMENEEEIRERTGFLNACTGPIHLTLSFISIAKKNYDRIIAFPSSMCYPMGHHEKDRRGFIQRASDAFAVHYWEGKNFTWSPPTK